MSHEWGSEQRTNHVDKQVEKTDKSVMLSTFLLTLTTQWLQFMMLVGQIPVNQYQQSSACQPAC